MGRPWSIVMSSREELDADVERWRPLLRRARCDRFQLPLRGAGECLVLTGCGEQMTMRKELDLEDELRLLRTPDLTWDQVDHLFLGQMVFLPMFGLDTFSITIDGFEPRTLVGGLDPLFHGGHRTALELNLRAAASVAAYHDLAIQIHP